MAGKPFQPVPGLAARRVAAELVDGVLRRRVPLDDLLASSGDFAALEDRDRALTRALVGAVLRRLGSLRHLIGLFLERGLPERAPLVETALLLGAAQILLLGVPDHAAVDLSVRLVREDRRAGRFSGLVNAVLRRITREGASRLAALDRAALDTPEWLLARWTKAYGAATARAIALAHAHEPALDLTVKSDPEVWAEKLGGRVLPTGSIRLISHGAVTALPGFAEGAWWVQDAAAALPARLFGDVRGLRIADLCAAPGGKTAQLAAAGAIVTAVDRAPGRLQRLADNLARLSLTAELVCADVADWRAPPFDAVLLDAPCSSTGTIRRHPDLPWLKQEVDIAALTELQRRLLHRAAALTKSGGTLIYCTCSLESEENEILIGKFLRDQPGLRRSPIMSGETFGLDDFISSEGDLRTLPCQFADTDSRYAGIDGFYAVRLVNS